MEGIVSNSKPAIRKMPYFYIFMVTLARSFTRSSMEKRGFLPLLTLTATITLSKDQHPFNDIQMSIGN